MSSSLTPGRRGRPPVRRLGRHRAPNHIQQRHRRGSDQKYATGPVRGTPGIPFKLTRDASGGGEPAKTACRSAIKGHQLRFSASTPLRPVPGRQSPVLGARAFAPRAVTQLVSQSVAFQGCCYGADAQGLDPVAGASPRRVRTVPSAIWRRRRGRRARAPGIQSTGVRSVTGSSSSTLTSDSSLHNNKDNIKRRRAL